MRELRPVQTAALEYAKRRKRIALFMQMRLGKTLVAIRWAKLNRLTRVLVTGPYTVLNDWLKELAAEEVAAMIYRTPFEKALLSELGAPEGFALLGFQGVISDMDLLALDWDAIIVDESVNIKDPKSKISKYLTNFCEHVPYRAILSGLPNPEDTMEFFQQYKFLLGNMLGYKNYYKFRFELFEQDGYEWEPMPGVEKLIRDWNDRYAFVQTRAQAGYKERKIRLRYRIPVPPEVAQAHRLALTQYATPVAEGEKWTNYAMVAAHWASRVSGGFSADDKLLSDYKLAFLKRLLQNQYAGKPVVVWFHYDAEIQAALKYLNAANVMALTGTTPLLLRGKVCSDFQNGALDVLLIQEQLGKYSLNLSRSSTAIYYSQYWNYDARAQSEDRLAMPGKEEDLTYIDLCGKGTVDENISTAVREKREDASYFMESVKRRIYAAR